MKRMIEIRSYPIENGLTLSLIMRVALLQVSRLVWPPMNRWEVKVVLSGVVH